MNYIRTIAAAAAIIIVLGFTQQKAEASPLLNIGSTGHDVTYIQSILQKLGYFNTETTGYYGPVTASAVEQFQSDFGIEITGGVGPKTAEMLNNVEIMAHIVYGEARGESYKGQVAVAAVILNRVHSSEFPDSIEEVIFQPNAFTAINDGQYQLQPDTTAFKAVKDAFLGWDPSYGSVYYYNPELATDTWILTRTVTNQIGNHRFAY